MVIAIFEKDLRRKELLISWLDKFMFQNHCDVPCISFTDDKAITRMKKYASYIQLAFISLENESGISIGNALYKENPDVRICYYADKSYNLERLLFTRPIHFYLWGRGEETFLSEVQNIYHEIEMSLTTFKYETKRRVLILPIRNIMYFQSDLRYIDIRVNAGENQRILEKLSNIENQTRGAFIRTHKSYLVNPLYIQYLDCRNHRIRLMNGEELPVSEAQYENTRLRLMNMK